MNNQFKPKLRDEAKLDMHAALHGAIAGAIGNVFNTSNYPFKTCLNCIRFQETNEHCHLFNARPPARVIAFGCNDYSDSRDEIPF